MNTSFSILDCSAHAHSFFILLYSSYYQTTCLLSYKKYYSFIQIIKNSVGAVSKNNESCSYSSNGNAAATHNKTPSYKSSRKIMPFAYIMWVRYDMTVRHGLFRFYSGTSFSCVRLLFLVQCTRVWSEHHKGNRRDGCSLFYHLYCLPAEYPCGMQIANIKIKSLPHRPAFYTVSTQRTQKSYNWFRFEKPLACSWLWRFISKPAAKKQRVCCWYQNSYTIDWKISEEV